MARALLTFVPKDSKAPKGACTSAYHPLKGIRVTVTGVGFWDELHGQGGNGNGFELHPVLSINLI